MDRQTRAWLNGSSVAGHTFRCGYCGALTAPQLGYLSKSSADSGGPSILICTGCNHPTYFPKSNVHGLGDRRIPGARPGKTVEHMPDAIARLYDEARDSIGAGTYVGAALVLRVLLLHVAKDRGLQEKGPTYAACVEFLVKEGFVAARERSFVDSVRVLGNQANHELGTVSEQEATEALAFMEHLLLGLYEHPTRIAKKGP